MNEVSIYLNAYYRGNLISSNHITTYQDDGNMKNLVDKVQAVAAGYNKPGSNISGYNVNVLKEAIDIFYGPGVEFKYEI